MHFLIALLSAFVLSVSSTQASALLAKHLQFVGWQLGDPSFSGWTATGTRRNGRAVDTLSEKHSGIAYRDTLSVDAGRISDDNGFTGSVFWESDPNGYTAKQIGAPAQIAYDVNLIRSEALSLIPDVTVGESTQINSVAATVLHVKPAVGFPMDVYEDSANGAFLQAMIDPQGPDRTALTIDSYTNIAPGKKAVSAWKIGSVQYTLSSISVAPVNNTELQPPAVRATWTFGQGTVPVQLFDLGVHQYQPRVTISVNGVPGTFVIDTSMPSIVLFDSFARSAGVEAFDGADFSGFSENAQYIGYARVQSLSAGNSTLHNVFVNRINGTDTRLAGLIGYDFFAGTIAEIDLSTGTMQLYDPTSMQPSVVAGAYAFTIDLTSRRPVIAVPLNAKTYSYPYFSTGEPHFMLLSQRLRDSGSVDASDVAIASQREILGVRRGVSGTTTVFNRQLVAYSDYTGASGTGLCALLRRAMIGPYPYVNSPICFVSGTFGYNGGAIGLDFLRHFDWTIDYPDEKFVLTPNNVK